MWIKKSAVALLVGMGIGAALIENTMGGRGLGEGG